MLISPRDGFSGGPRRLPPFFFCRDRVAPPYFGKDRASDCVRARRRPIFFLKKKKKKKVFAPLLKIPGSAPDTSMPLAILPLYGDIFAYKICMT